MGGAAATSWQEASLPFGSHRTLVTAETPKSIKRFYKDVSVKEVSDGAWCIVLDTKDLKTPKGSALHLPSRPLAESLAEEWEAQVDKVKPLEMPLTTLACTAVDLVRPDRGACIDRMLPYLTSDTVCYEDEREGLLALQEAEWRPLREWYEASFGVKLGVARGLLM